MDWKADLHSCGHHLSETLTAKPDAYAIVTHVCKACAAREKQQFDESKADKKAIDEGAFVPVSARLHEVMTLADAKAFAAAQAAKQGNSR